MSAEVERVDAPVDRSLEHTEQPPPAGKRDAGEPGGREPSPPPGVDRPRAEERKRSSFLGTIVEVVLIVTAAFVIALLVQAFLVKPFTIHQVSMRPTLEEGDRILLNRLAYSFGEPSRGDVVVFHSPINPDEDLVKRIVGTGGDRLSISGGRLYVDGAEQGEPYLLEQEFQGEMAETVVPEGDVFVLGDNRNNSGDSRTFGPVDEDSIIGRAFVIYWPFGHWKGL